MYVWRNIEARSCNHCCSRKAISNAYSECVSVPLVIQNAMCVRHIVTCPAPLYSIFPHYLTKGMVFEKKLLNTKCVFLFPLQLLSESFLIIRRTDWDMMKNVYCSLCKVTVIVRFFTKLEFSWQIFEKNIQISNFMKIHPVGAQLFHAYRRTDRHDEANSLFSQFCEGA